MTTPTTEGAVSVRDPRRPPWRRPAVLVVAGLAVALLIVVLVVFQPQRLLYDVTVDEGFPTAEASDDVDVGGEVDPPAIEEPAGAAALGAGAFASRGRYTTTGTATTYQLPDGSRTLRLEGFETTNGPDLYVYLTAADAAASDPELDADVVDLGRLRGNVGNLNHDIPTGVDLDTYDTVVIWCRRFSVSFGVADLHARP